MNTYEYAKFVSETQINKNVPREAVYEGKTYVGDLSTIPGLLESLGWKLVLRPQKPDDPREGYHYEERYADEEGGIQVSWVEVADPPPPPRTFSKFKLKLAIADAGFLTEFEQLLASVEVKPGYSGAAAFADAVTLDENHPKFEEAVAAVKQTFGLTDEQIEAILAQSVAE